MKGQERKRQRDEAGQSGQDKPAAVPEPLSVEQTVAAAKVLNNDDLQRLNEEIGELAKASARSTPPSELANWGFKLVPTEPKTKYDEYKYYILKAKGQEYEVKASYDTWLMAAGTVENRCGKFYIGNLLQIVKHTYAEEHNIRFGFRRLRKEFRMSMEQLNVLLSWLYKVIGDDVDLELVESVTWDVFHRRCDDEDDEVEEEEEDSEKEEESS